MARFLPAQWWRRPYEAADAHDRVPSQFDVPISRAPLLRFDQAET
jgi:hypothetical protein